MEVRYALIGKHPPEGIDDKDTPEQVVALGMRNVMALYARSLGMELAAVYTASEVVARPGFGREDGTMVRITFEEVPYSEVGQ